jgi:hypothetical protein
MHRRPRRIAAGVDPGSSGGGVDEALLDLAFAVSPIIGIER